MSRTVTETKYRDAVASDDCERDIDAVVEFHGGAVMDEIQAAIEADILAEDGGRFEVKLVLENRLGRLVAVMTSSNGEAMH